MGQRTQVNSNPKTRCTAAIAPNSPHTRPCELFKLTHMRCSLGSSTSVKFVIWAPVSTLIPKPHCWPRMVQPSRMWKVEQPMRATALTSLNHHDHTSLSPTWFRCHTRRPRSQPLPGCTSQLPEYFPAARCGAAAVFCVPCWRITRTEPATAWRTITSNHPGKLANPTKARIR